jgi:adenylosuccinate synthase
MKKTKNITAKIVIGLGYGDEGKGITTDYLCSQAKNPIVIRFSGGQQAGHTVMTNGMKHIHSNFGAGTLRGIPSYFSEHTVFYPATIAREMKVLNDKGISTRLVLHPLAKMTTPYDVFDNRADSNNLKDGSCGLGISKTMKRTESPFKLYAIDLLDNNTLLHKLLKIATRYYGDEKLNIAQTNELTDFMDAVKEIKWEIIDYDFLTEFDELIFEGSQGILLDMDHGIFPHVTHANTTSKNAHEILDKLLNVTKRDIYYVTRCYSTRHGSGPFLDGKLNLINNEEEINVFNEYQKDFKTNILDYKKLNFALAVDDIYSHGKVGVTKNLMVTCLDQFTAEPFHYDKLNTTFTDIYQSCSPITENIFKKCENNVAL